MEFLLKRSVCSRFNTAFTIKRGASQQIKRDFREDGGEEKKKLFTSKGSVCIAKNCDIVLEKAAISRPRSQFFPYTDLPAGQITYLF